MRMPYQKHKVSRDLPNRLRESILILSLEFALCNGSVK